MFSNSKSYTLKRLQIKIQHVVICFKSTTYTFKNFEFNMWFSKEKLKITPIFSEKFNSKTNLKWKDLLQNHAFQKSTGIEKNVIFFVVNWVKTWIYKC